MKARLWFGVPWLIFGVFTTASMWSFRAMMGIPTVWLTTTSVMWGMVVWAGLSVALWEANRRFRPARWSLSKRVFAIATAFVVCVFVDYLRWGLWSSWLYWADPALTSPTGHFRLAQLGLRLPNDVLYFSVIVGAIVAVEKHVRLVRQQRAAAELQTELARAQVSALRMQLNPHFLFNTLNGIAEMVHERPYKAEEAIAELSDLLRGALKAPAEGTSLADELDWLRRYLDLQALRFEDALDVVLDVPDDLLGARVPGFLLQPLVENAFEHGVARVTRPGHVVVRARRDGDRLVIDVVDNGPGLPGGDGVPAPGRGIGVSTTRRRLAQTYGDRAELTLSDRADGPGVRARVVLPADG